jgi:cell division protein FtsB
LLPGLSLEEKKTLIENAQNKQLQPVGQETYTFYRAKPLRALGWRKSRKIVSSLTEMDHEVRTWRNLGIGSFIAFISLTLSLLAFGANLYRQNNDLTRQLVDGKNELHQANERISKLENFVDHLARLEQQSLSGSSTSDTHQHKQGPR